MHNSGKLRSKVISSLLVVLSILALLSTPVSGRNPHALIKAAQSIRILVTTAKTAEQFSYIYKTSATTKQLWSISKGTEAILSLNRESSKYPGISSKISCWEKHEQISELWETTPHSLTPRHPSGYDIVIGHRSNLGTLVTY
jgi:hypothetical protein